MKYAEFIKEGMTLEEINQAMEKVVQSEGDKLRTQYTQKIKELETKIPSEKNPQELEFESRLKALEQREQEIQLRDVLDQNKLPKELAKFLKADDLATIGSELGQVLNSYLGTQGYQPNNHRSTETVVTKEQFKAMGYQERATFSEQHPELYQQYTANK